jgi:hypothetical protein
MGNENIVEIQRRFLKLLYKQKKSEPQERARLKARLVALQRAVKFISAN